MLAQAGAASEGQVSSHGSLQNVALGAALPPERQHSLAVMSPARVLGEGGVPTEDHAPPVFVCFLIKGRGWGEYEQ